MKVLQPLWSRGLTIIVVGLSLSGCLTARPVKDFASQAPEMSPEAFFSGSAHSWGVLETAGGAPSKIFHVASHGQAQPDGSFRLDQTIAFEGESPKARTWILQRRGAHDYVASLTDASGEVVGEAYGPLFHLRYPMKSPPGATMEQWMYLQPDGRTLMNEAAIRLAGVGVARLSELISRDGGPVAKGGVVTSKASAARTSASLSVALCSADFYGAPPCLPLSRSADRERN